MPEKKFLKKTLQINIFLEIFPNYLKQKNHPNNCFRGHDTDYEIRFLKTILNFPFYLY